MPFTVSLPVFRPRWCAWVVSYLTFVLAVLALCPGLRAQQGRSFLIATVAGNGTQGFSGGNGPAISAQFYGPTGIAVESAGSLYIADNENQRIRKVAQSRGDQPSRESGRLYFAVRNRFGANESGLSRRASAHHGISDCESVSSQRDGRRTAGAGTVRGYDVCGHIPGEHSESDGACRRKAAGRSAGGRTSITT